MQIYVSSLSSLTSCVVLGSGASKRPSTRIQDTFESLPQVWSCFSLLLCSPFHPAPRDLVTTRSEGLSPLHPVFDFCKLNSQTRTTRLRMLFPDPVHTCSLAEPDPPHQTTKAKLSWFTNLSLRTSSSLALFLTNLILNRIAQSTSTKLDTNFQPLSFS